MESERIGKIKFSSLLEHSSGGTHDLQWFLTSCPQESFSKELLPLYTVGVFYIYIYIYVLKGKLANVYLSGKIQSICKVYVTKNSGQLVEKFIYLSSYTVLSSYTQYQMLWILCPTLGTFLLLFSFFFLNFWRALVINSLFSIKIYVIFPLLLLQC